MFCNSSVDRKNDYSARSTSVNTAFIPCCLFHLALLTTIVCLAQNSLFAKEKKLDLSSVKIQELQCQTFESKQGQVNLNVFSSQKSIDSLDPFVLTIELETPKELVPSSNDIENSYGDFLLEKKLDVVQDKSESTNRLIRQWNVYPNRRGKTSLPPIPIVLSNKSGEETFIVQTKALEFDIQEIEIVETEVEKVDFDRTKIVSYSKLIIALAALAAIGWVIFHFFRRSKSSNFTNILTEIEQEDPYNKALRLLNELKESPIYLEDSQIFYTDVSTILRVYLSERFGLKAEECTTTEILNEIKNTKAPIWFSTNIQGETPNSNSEQHFVLSDEETSRIRQIAAVETLKHNVIVDTLEKSLNVVDLVKFANQPTKFSDASQVFKQIQDVIENAEKIFNELTAKYQTLAISRFNSFQSYETENGANEQSSNFSDVSSDVSLSSSTSSQTNPER